MCNYLCLQKALFNHEGHEDLVYLNLRALRVLCGFLCLSVVLFFLLTLNSYSRYIYFLWSFLLKQEKPVQVVFQWLNTNVVVWQNLGILMHLFQS